MSLPILFVMGGLAVVSLFEWVKNRVVRETKGGKVELDEWQS